MKKLAVLFVVSAGLCMAACRPAAQKQEVMYRKYLPFPIL